MDARREIQEFLSSRRAKLEPKDVGLPDFGARRVPGLRREEVAILSGVSAPYYARLERGDLAGASDGVLEALAGALRLDDAERSHLYALASAAKATAPRRRRSERPRIRPTVQRMVDSIGDPAIISTTTLDYVAFNTLGRALYAPIFESVEQPANSARFIFLDPAAHDFYPEWDRVAKETLAHLRSVAGRDPHDRTLTDLVGELSTRSDEFRTWWAAHNVRHHRTGEKTIHHPIVGEVQLTYEVLDVAADDGLMINVYGTEPASRSRQALDLLASWTSTPTESSTGPPGA